LGAQIREWIAAEVREVAGADPGLREKLAAMGQVLNPGSPSKFAAVIEDQKARAAAVGRLLGIKAAER
jgi:hypothetical protein